MKQSARTTILTLWGALVTALALSLSITAPAVALDPGGREEALPTTPPPDPSVPSIGTTVLSDGTPVGIVVAGGNGGLLHVVDLNTRTLRSRERLVPENTDVQPWEFATLSNRHVMLASGGGQLFEIDPDAPEGQKATNLSDPSRPGYEQVAAYSTFLWDVAVDEHDRVYVATQSNHGGHILRYDPSANQGRGQWTDLLPGGVQAGESDVRSLAYDNGFLYAGTGTKNPSIVRINTSTNAATKLAVPSHVTAGLSHLERLQVKAGNLYVGTNVPGGVRPACGGTCVLDPVTGAQKMKDGKALEVDTWSSQVVTRPGEAEKVYYTVQSHNTPTLQEYDPRTNTSRTLAQGLASTARPSQSSWATHEHFISAGKDDASIAIVHASDGSATGLPKDANGGNAIQGSPRDIQSLTAVPGGDLYASWYMTAPMLLRATPNAQVDKTQYSLPQAPLGQVEGFGHSNKWFVTGIYPSGELVRYEMGASGPTLENHQSVRITSDARQARPYVIVPINDDEFAVGTSPKNKAGSGALSIYDAAHNKIDTYPLDTINYADPSLRGLLSDRRPLSIVHHQDKLYVGTSASGNGMNPEQTEASAPRLFEFDLKTRKVTRVMTPFKDQRSITALTLGSDGTVYGTTGMHVFAMIPADFTIGRSRALTRQGYADANRSQLIERDGVLYGIMAGRLRALSTSLQDEGTVIADFATTPQGKVYVNSLALGADGSLYYARGSRIYRYRFPAG